MTYTATEKKALGLRGSAARKARGVLAATVVAAAMVVPALAAGLVAHPAHASTTFTVNSTSDLGDPITNDAHCSIPDFSGEDHCSLRAAIQNANGTPGADVIDFDIPATGVQTIHVNSQGFGPLPDITDQVSINGYSQKDASPNTKAVGDNASLKIELAGVNAPSTGLRIKDSSGSIIRGLDIHGFGTGIEVRGSSVGNRIEGNFVGTDPTGASQYGNSFDGISVSPGADVAPPSRTVVGGSTPGKRNVISGNGDYGIHIFGSDGSVVRGNYVGTDASGTLRRGNSAGGVYLQSASNTTIGGTTATSRNLLSGNTGDGVVVVFSQGTEVLGNRIGTTASGAAPLGNNAMGVNIGGGTSGTLVGDGTLGGSNTIAFNAKDGVQVEDSSSNATTVGNRVSGDSIFSNGGLGIDLVGLGETTTTDVSNANDALDTDSGPNDLQNKPSLGSAKTVSGKTTIKGTLSSAPSTGAAVKTYKIEFYSNPSDGDEGKKFIGAKSVSTGSDGKATFTFTPATKVPAGRTVTATATDVTTGSPHDTSEFSAPKTVTSA